MTRHTFDNVDSEGTGGDGVRRDPNDWYLRVAVLLLAALALTACGTNRAPQGPAQPTPAPIVIPPAVVDMAACWGCLALPATARPSCEAMFCPATPEPRPSATAESTPRATPTTSPAPTDTPAVATPSSTPPAASPTATNPATPSTSSTPQSTPGPTQTQAPASPTWVTRLVRVNGFAGCNPGQTGRTSCHGDRTFWFAMPGFDILARDVNCEISCARRPGDTNCINACNRNDSPGTPCGGAPACDQDHLSCERVRIGCNGKSWDDPRGSVLKATGQIQCDEAPDHYGFNCSGTPGSNYMLCARPFADAHTEDGTPILVQGTGEWCAAGIF